MFASTVATAPGTRRAAARAVMAAIGLRLCGIADEPPGAFSDTSASSVADIDTMSPAIFAMEPAAIPNAQARSATVTRSVCQGAVCGARPRASASAAAMAGPCGCTAAIVPAAPPYCTQHDRRTAARR
ncbi:unannotated protein [freshwater metagenome]|uniref:Unannotated protein n=1 Tax=freshwater metagenome TaxID=449393 RepID=A0A6J7ECX4_9ZZZZ